jgi:uroporphyrin-3 C-methyltransferase
MRSQYIGRMVIPLPDLANTGMSAIDTEKTPDAVAPVVPKNNEASVTASATTQSSSSSLTRAALLISLLALTAAGWTAWQLVDLQGIPLQISSDAGKLQNLSSRIDGLAQRSDRQQSILTDLESSLESGLEVIPDLSLRLAQSEEQLANIPGINVRSRVDLLKKEALYYLQIANAQATLAGNAQVAASALQLADDKLRDAGDPSLTRVRAQLSEELVALKAVPVIDLTGISFRLQALAVQTETWPFRNAAPNNFSPDIQVGNETAEDAGAWERFVATVKAVFSSIVSVKETDVPHATQLGSAEEALVLEIVKAELQVARLALISGNAELFSQSLVRVNAQIYEYFVIDATAVNAALTTLVEFQALELPGPLPDISGSAALLLSITGNAPDKSGSDRS